MGPIIPFTNTDRLLDRGDVFRLRALGAIGNFHRH